MEKIKAKQSWYKNWWGIIVLILFWPFSLSYWIWKGNLDKKVKIVLLVALWIFALIIFSSTANQKSFKQGYQAGQEVGMDITQTTSTPTPSPTSAPDNLKKLFNEIDNAKPDDIIFSVSTNSGHIQAHRESESENSWVVIEIMNRWPEISVEFSLKNKARDFIYQVYHSNHDIKQAGITINGSSGKYYRVFLGANQAKTLTEEDWKNLMPTNFINWIKEVETGRNEERINSTFIEENIN